MEPETNSEPLVPAQVALAARLAFATVTLWPLVDERAQGTSADRARAMAIVPIAGFALGVVLFFADYSLAGAMPILSRSLITIALGSILSLGLAQRGIADTVQALKMGGRLTSTGLARVGPIAMIAGLGAFAAEVYALSTIASPPPRAFAIMMAMTLSRFSFAAVGYGLKPLEHWGLGIPFEGGITFAVFATASVCTILPLIAIYGAGGLVVFVAFALAVIAIRRIFSRVLGGASGFALAGACGVIELGTIVLIALLAR
jgi:cobalamin synthase